MKKTSPLKWRLQLAKVLSIADSVLSLSVHLQDLKSPWALATLAVRGAEAIVSHSEEYGDPLHGYKLIPWDSALSVGVFNIYKTRRELLDANGIWEKEFEDGKRLYWLMSPEMQVPEGPYYRNDTEDETLEESFLERMRADLWEEYENQIYISSGDTNILLQPDPLRSKPILSSQRVDDLWDEYQKLMDGGESLSVLLYGPSGSGKTTAARYISKLAGGHFARLRVSGLGQMYRGLTILEGLKPSAICIEDIDRCDEAVLEMIDSLRSLCPLLVVTANSLNGMDPALLRPERFDEIEFFEKLDDKVYEDLLKDIDEDIHEVLRELPIAYIAYYKRYEKTLGSTRALEKLEALTNRAEVVADMFRKLEGVDEGGVDISSKPPEEWDINHEEETEHEKQPPENIEEPET